MVLGLVAATTVVMALGSTRVVSQVDIEEFAPADRDASLALERIQNDLGAEQAGVSVIIDAGEGSSVLDAGGIELAGRITSAIRDDEESSRWLAADSPVRPSIVSFATPALELLENEAGEPGVDPEESPGDELADAIAQIYADPAVSEQIGDLLSSSEETEPTEDGDVPTARAGLVNVTLANDLDEVERIDAGLSIRSVVEDVDSGDLSVVAFSDGILQDDLQGAMDDEIPLLMGLALLVIVVVLAGALRDLVDVLVSLGAIALALVWTFGVIGYLGPEGLGVTGGFSQLAVAVPVILIGLGVDYSFHLIGRYREELAAGTDPADAITIPPRTVGRALVLVTATTVTGFLANLVSPLPPVVDFAVFMAAGITCVLVVFLLFVPSARFLVDRHRSVGRADGDVPISGRPGPVTRAMSGAGRLAARAPIPVLVVTGLAAGAGVVGGLQLDTEFSQEQFIPDDTDAGGALGTMQELFGGEVTERSHLLVEGDVDDPRVLDAMLDAGDQLAASDQAAGGGQSVSSAAHLVARLDLAARGEDQSTGGEVPEDLADALAEAGWTGDDGFGDDADVAGILALAEEVAGEQLAGLIDTEQGLAVVTVETRAGPDGLSELVRDAGSAAEIIREAGAEATFTNLPLVVEETLDALVDAQAQKIALSTLVALVVLVAYFGVSHRRPGLGAITIVPTVVTVPMVLGGMWVVGLSFNALTATVAAIAIGFGVDYGIHLGNRFLEERERSEDAAEALHGTITHSGTALTASALTTAGAFTVLVVFGDLEPVRQFGAVTAMVMVLALLTTLLTQSSCLALWDRRLRRQEASTGGSHLHG